jgi:hypothetical protein
MRNLRKAGTSKINEMIRRLCGRKTANPIAAIDAWNISEPAIVQRCWRVFKKLSSKAD